ncbi:MAG: hypothetical protein HN416_16155 [Nitrospina sp.]|nr:hypothetical protein [Nitrospina sp.]
MKQNANKEILNPGGRSPIQYNGAQLLTYMKLTQIKQGFLINFNVEVLKNGLKSFIL